MRMPPITNRRATAYAKVTGYSADEIMGFRRKYVNLRHHCKERMVDCELTFVQFIKLVKVASLSSHMDIGRRAGQYQLGRFGDDGPYSIENCRFITVEQNRRESVQNGGQLVGNIKHSGSLNGSAKLTESDVILIRSYRAAGRSQAALCDEFGVSPATMSQIINKTLWRHI